MAVAESVSLPEQVFSIWINKTQKLAQHFKQPSTCKGSNVCSYLGTVHKIFLTQLLNAREKQNRSFEPQRIHQQIHKAVIKAHGVLCQHLNLT